MSAEKKKIGMTLLIARRWQRWMGRVSRPQMAFYWMETALKSGLEDKIFSLCVNKIHRVAQEKSI